MTLNGTKPLGVIFIGVCEFAGLLSVNNITVWRSRMILQRKDNEVFAE